MDEPTIDDLTNGQLVELFRNMTYPRLVKINDCRIASAKMPGEDDFVLIMKAIGIDKTEIQRFLRAIENNPELFEKGNDDG